ncbi:MAG: DUF5916 domain-containing protein [Bacteroidota bacterium]
MNHRLSLPALTTWIGIPFAVVLFSSAGWAVEDPSETSTYTLHANRIQEEAVDLDGWLTEEVWQRADVGTGFTQREPADGNPSTERTEVRVLYCSDAIYVGVRAFDSRPDEIRSELARRDGRSQSDEIGIYFDSYHDRRTAFEFTVNPRGSIRDVYYFGDSPENSDDSWDPVWEVRTAIDSDGWTVEFRIPFTQLRFDRGKTTWGFQVYRRIQRKAEEVYWAPYSKEASGFVSLFGTLEGFKGLSQPMRLEVRPYTVVNNRYRPESSGSLYAPRQQAQFDGGLDLKYGITSDFTLDLSVNPDFGQVEADPSVVNLSAFETFFPEKRPFFVEGSGLFSVSLPVGQLFYSRRIGRSPQGSPDKPAGGTAEIPEATTIITAAKVTGKSAGGLGLGIMSAVTAEEKATLRDSTAGRVGQEIVEPLTHYFASRIEQDFRQGSHTIGTMVTAVNRKLTDNSDFLRSAAYVAEVDGVHRWQKNTYAVRWRFAGSHLRGGREAITAAQRSSLHYYQRPDASHLQLDTTRTSLSGYTLRLQVDKEAGTWRYRAIAGRVTPGFDVSDLGFQSELADANYFWLFGEYLQARPQWIFRDYRVSVGLSRHWTTAGDITFSWFRPVYMEATFRNNWSLTVNPIAVGGARIDVTALRGGPALRKNPWRNSFLGITTDRRKRLAMKLWIERGGIFGARGDWFWSQPTLYIRPSDVLNVTLSLTYLWDRDARQWVGRMTGLDSTRYIVAEIGRKELNLTTRVNWILTPTLSVEFYGQPFVSSGAYTEFKEVIAPRVRKFNDRFRFYDDELVCTEDGGCNVDLDGDGATDFSFSRPDFSFRQLRSTLVIRWEYHPGSVLFLAWQHGRQSFLADGSFGGFRHIADLFMEDSDNTFLVKVNYWFSL